MGGESEQTRAAAVTAGATEVSDVGHWAVWFGAGVSHVIMPPP